MLSTWMSPRRLNNWILLSRVMCIVQLSQSSIAPVQTCSNIKLEIL